MPYVVPPKPAPPPQQPTPHAEPVKNRLSYALFTLVALLLVAAFSDYLDSKGETRVFAKADFKEPQLEPAS